MADDQQTALGHYQAAERELDAALAIDANSAEAHFRRGVLSLYLAELTSDDPQLVTAVDHFRQAIAIKPDFAMAYYNLARCLDKQRQPVEAVEAMRKSLTLDPNYLPARRALGGLLMKVGRLQEAMAELEQVVEIDPNDQKARGWLEMLHRDLGTR
jgi:tetratricopeptide (TPR) repeat protein